MYYHLLIYEYSTGRYVLLPTWISMQITCGQNVIRVPSSGFLSTYYLCPREYITAHMWCEVYRFLLGLTVSKFCLYYSLRLIFPFFHWFTVSASIESGTGGGKRSERLFVFVKNSFLLKDITLLYSRNSITVGTWTTTVNGNFAINVCIFQRVYYYYGSRIKNKLTHIQTK